MAAVACERPHLARPAPRFPGLCPCGADERVRTIDLVDGAIGRALVADRLFFAADVELKGWLGLDAPRGMDAAHLEQVGNVLLIVDLIEEGLFVWIDVHADHKNVTLMAG